MPECCKKDPLLSFYLEYILILVSRTLPKRIVRSREIAEAFVKTNVSGHKPVPGDGYCIIHAFRENLLSIGCRVTFDDLTTCLRNDLQSKKYQTFKTDDINIVNELEQNHCSLSRCSWHGLQSKHQDLTK